MFGTEELALPKSLRELGLLATASPDAAPYTGLVGGQLRVESVDPGSPADRAGLMIPRAALWLKDATYLPYPATPSMRAPLAATC